MRRISAIILISCLFINHAVAQSWVKKATKSVFTLKTFSADGSLLGSSNGFFVGEAGEAVSSFSPFKGASSAIVIDAQGNEMPVACMLGASDTYDVAKFRVDAKKTQPLSVATANAGTGTGVWILPYRETKDCPEGTIRRAENFRDDYAYYTIAIAMPEQAVGCPLVNSAGEAIGLMQQPARQNDSLNYAVSARFADSLAINGLSINEPALRSTLIKKDLPKSLDQALLTIFVAGSSLDSASYATLIDDFILRFPQAAEGYTYRAQNEMLAGRYDDAARDMEQAIKNAERKDEAHYAYSRLIFEKLTSNVTPYEPWTLDKALDEASEAYRINPQPIYRNQQAALLYSQRKYEEAGNIYMELTQSPLRSAELFFYAAQCKLMQRDTVAQLALLDSAVAQYNRPYLKEAAPYIFARAQARLDAGKYRDAVSDLNDYEQLMATNVNDRFYYIRHQADLGGRLFQQALNDIDRAIELAPDNDLYQAEKASLQIRVGLYDEAMETARECIRLQPDYSEGYLFLGLAQCLKGQKDEGLKNLQKAKEMGDTQADGLIEKYSK